MDRNEIAALLEALCEQPLAEGQAASPELQAFRRRAAEALSESSRGADETDAEALTAALAAVLSGTDTEAARRLVEQAALRSAAVRLDAQSALAFVEAVEQAPHAAPADLVDEIVADERAADAAPAAAVGGSRLWSVIGGGSWSARRWGLAAACTVLLVAGATSWSVLRQQPDVVPMRSTSVPMAKTGEPLSIAPPPAVADAPTRAKRAVATAPGCDQRVAETARTDNVATNVATPAEQSAADCARQLADREREEHEARIQAEAARQAAGAEAAGKLGAGQGSRPASEGDAQAGRSGPSSGPAARAPAAAVARPPVAASPASPPTAPPTGAR